VRLRYEGEVDEGEAKSNLASDISPNEGKKFQILSGENGDSLAGLSYVSHLSFSKAMIRLPGLLS